MLPIVWFYIALVIVLWGLLAYFEVQRRKQQKCKGCLELETISADRLWSLMIIDPQLVLLELRDRTSAADPVLIHRAIPVTADQLSSRLLNAGQTYAFYTRTADVVPWQQVDTAVCAAGLKKGFVLEGDPESWKHSHLPFEARMHAPVAS